MNRNILAALIFSAIAIILAGCDSSNKPLKYSTINDASEIIKQNIKTPSSFKLISGEEIWSGTNTVGQPVYIVRVEYDAQNTFGAIIRNRNLVAFYATGSNWGWDKKNAIQPCEIKSSDGYVYTDEKAMIRLTKKINFGIDSK